MKVSKYIYAGIILLIYVPLVFMGANVFFPKYTGPESYYLYEQCPTTTDAVNKECLNGQEKKRVEFEKEKNKYDIRKYLFIVIFSLISLIIVGFIRIEDIIRLGIFLGATISTFVSTLVYFDTKSKIGFAILVLIFILVIYYINKNKKELFNK